MNGIHGVPEMTWDRDNPLAVLIRDRLEELGWSHVDLVTHLGYQGLVVTASAVSYWCQGAGVAEAKRARLADALGIPVLQLTTAARRRAEQRAL